MKKNILLLIGFLISCNLFAVDTYTHDPQTVCEEGQTIQPFLTNVKDGNSYQWFIKRNGNFVSVGSGTETTSFTPSEAGEYKCEITKEILQLMLYE
jgi:hypothetical protein